MGIVRLDEVTRALYSNSHLDLGAHAGKVQLKVTFLNADGEYEEKRTVSLEPRGVRFFSRLA